MFCTKMQVSVLKFSGIAFEPIKMAVLIIQRVILCYGLNPKCEDLLAECIQADLRCFSSQFSSKFTILQTKYMRSEKSQSPSLHLPEYHFGSWSCFKP